MGKTRSVVLLLLSSIVLACGSELPDEALTDSASENSNLWDQVRADRLRALDHDLDLGSTGLAVEAVNSYLGAFGYFPNVELAERYPAWRPIVTEGPSSPSTYDERTKEAVETLQRTNDLPVTGVVDQATRELMNMPRCGVPDGHDAADQSEKFAIMNKWWGNVAKWWINNDDWNTIHINTAAMIDKWAAATNLAFPNTSDSPDITISFGSLGAGTLASTSRPAWYDYSADITVNTNYSWHYGDGAPPAGKIDYKSVILHELGHAIGLDHSSIGPAVMRGNYAGVKRDLTLDDRVGVSSMYDQWALVDSDVSDIAIGAAGDIWVVAPSTHNVWKLDAAGWHNIGADASRIAVGGNGWPYVIAGWGDGTIWYYNSSTPGAGTWQQMPGGGCAKDIGASPEGIGTNAIWVIGCGSGADTTIWKYTGGGWTQDRAGGLAAKISVDHGGIPWVTTAGGGVFRYSSNNPLTGTWSLISSTPYAQDIGVGPNLYGGNYPWITTTSQTIHVLNQQPYSSEGSPPAPQRHEWRQLAGYAARVAVGPGGDPWVVDTQNRLWRTQK